MHRESERIGLFLVFGAILIFIPNHILVYGQIQTSTTSRYNLTTTTYRYINTTTTVRSVNTTTTRTTPITSTRYLNVTTSTRPTTVSTTTRPLPVTTSTSTTPRPVVTTTSTRPPTTTTRYLNITTTSTRPTTVSTTTRPLPVTTSTSTTPRPVATTTTTTPPGIIQCNYFQHSSIYGCELSINNPNGQEFSVIPGNHHPMKLDSDVVKVTAEFQNTRNIPTVICRKFPNLRSLILIWSEISHLTADSFRSCSNLATLNLHGNKIRIIPTGIFVFNRNLVEINLNRNGIESVANDAFDGTRLVELNLGINEITRLNSLWFTSVNETLKTLIIPGNRITSSSISNFDNMRNLLLLDLSMNPLRSLQTSAFNSLINLKHLKIDNCFISQLEGESFLRLSNLISVSFNDNFVSDLPAGIFVSLPKLLEISFSGNRIKKIDSRSFGSNLQNLRSIYAQTNNLDSIDPDFLNGAKQLTNLFLLGNDCTNKNFIIESGSIEIVKRELEICLTNFRYIRCQYTGTSVLSCNMSIRNLVGRDDIEAIEGDFPMGTNNSNVISISSTIGTSRIIPNIICRQFVNLQEFHASLNGISSITSASFASCKNLRSLSLVNQNITSIPDSAFESLANLENLNLAFNKIQTIGSRIFSGLTSRLRTINLYSNIINRIDAGAFSDLRGINSIDFSNNRLSYLNSTCFGSSLNSLKIFDGSSNQINEIDPMWFNNAATLETLTLTFNSCINAQFVNISNNRQYVYNQLTTCFNRFNP